MVGKSLAQWGSAPAGDIGVLGKRGEMLPHLNNVDLPGLSRPSGEVVGKHFPKNWVMGKRLHTPIGVQAIPSLPSPNRDQSS